MVNFVANLTPEAACEALRGAGMICSPEDVQIIAREERWAVSLPGDPSRPEVMRTNAR
jgi:hypothetical protein